MRTRFAIPALRDAANGQLNRLGRTSIAVLATVCVACGLITIGVATGRSASSSAPELNSQEQAARQRSGVADTTDNQREISRGGDSGGRHAFTVRPLRLSTATLPRSNAADAPSAPRNAAVFNLDLRSTALNDGVVSQFNGRPIRVARTLNMRVTAYSPDARSCGGSADGITASGHAVTTNGGFLVAADPKLLPLGSMVSLDGYDGGAVVPVLDVGGAIKGSRLDILFPTHEAARKWGVRDVEVTVWEYADGKPNGFKRVRRPSK
ncbi:MAG: hypothetical protein DWI10_03900 [Planctomycetota bacterium]|nr:MAG: hypothetical protein DWI10_03900 [Planctomycetota bacterium]